MNTIFCVSSCNDLAMTSYDQTVLSGHVDGSLRSWDIKSGKSTFTIPNLHTKQITSVTISPDGQTALTLGRDNVLKVVDLRTWETLRVYSDEGFRVGVNWAKACFSPDGSFLAAGGAEGSIFIWNTSSQKLVRQLSSKEAHSSTITCVAWHPNAVQFASCDRKANVVLWDCEKN